MSSLLSTDPNPIEHICDVVERKIQVMDVQPKNMQQLRDAVMLKWTNWVSECVCMYTVYNKLVAIL